jgi:L-alanine-DL-glutamate epimerase-like enolase superfamily enzyme
MKVTRLKTAVVEGNFDWTFVRIETDKGIKGTGECFPGPALPTLVRELEPVLQGEDPRDVRRLFRKLQLATSGTSAVAGLVYNAITGIETALWDVLGQWLGTPVYQLLGGKFRDRIRIYADCHGGEALESLDCVMRTRRVSWVKLEEPHHPKNYFEETADKIVFAPEMYAERARTMAARGFTALKFDIDVPNPYVLDRYNRCLTNREIDYMVSLVAGVREAVGFDIDVAVDCHWRFNANDIRKVAKACEPLRLMWLEDPVPPENVDVLREIRASTTTPIASGENLYQFEGFRRILEQQALSIISPDIQKVGGLNEARRIAEFADSYYVAVAPHNVSSSLGTIASTHFCASIPNFLVLEFHASDVPFWDDLVDGIPKPIIQNGYISVPNKPGLGVTLNEEVARRYARRGEPFFE